MTVSESIIQWLRTFDLDAYRKLTQIDTDLMHGDVDYALVKEPVIIVKRWLSGAEVHKDHYQIRARLDTMTNDDCIENGAWLEALTDWIHQQDNDGNYPVLERAEVRQIGVSTPFYMGATSDGKAIYQMTIYIEYMKGAIQ